MPANGDGLDIYTSFPTGTITAGNFNDGLDIVAELLGGLYRLEKPGASKRPVIFGRGDRNAKKFRGFLNREASKIAKLNHLSFDRMFHGELVKRFMHG